MALALDQKFSTFIDGGVLSVNDIIVGLRNGVNTKFLYNGILPPGVIVPIVNGGTGADSALAATINLGVEIGVNVEAWSANLDSIAELSGTGFVVQTAANTFVERSLTATANQINIANPAGVAGNVTFTLSSTLNLPGTFNIQGTTAVSAIIDDNTMVTALHTNLATALSIKTYVDSKVAGDVTSLTGTANQILVNGTSGSPQTGDITLTIPNGSGIDNWVTVSGSSQVMSINTGYFVSQGNSSLITFTLPSVFPEGSRVAVIGIYDNLGWNIPVAVGTSIQFPTLIATSPLSINSSSASDSIYLRASVANSVWSYDGGSSTGYVIQ